MNRTTPKRVSLLSPVLAVLLLMTGVCLTFAEDAEPDKDQPKRPGITRVKPGTDIKDIKSDPFKMASASVHGDVLKIKVSYTGGDKPHTFALYWNGIVARSYPGRTAVHLKHDANEDAGEKKIEKTIEFDLTAITKPMHIAIRTDHGDSTSVMYGKSKLGER